MTALTTAPTTATTTAASEPTTTPAGGDCPADSFPDLAGTPGAGDGYDAPSVTATCADGMLTVQSNGMISYPFVAITPNPLLAQTYEWSVPLEPTWLDEPDSIVDRLGTLGFTVTGIPIYGPTEGAQPVAEAYGDPVANGLLDDCGGHTGPHGEYHHHSIDDEVAMCNLDQVQVVGYAIDGYPIYNTVVCLDIACDTRGVAESGYEVIGDVSSHVWDAVAYVGAEGAGTATSNVLDECNGRTEPDGSYGYHVTTTAFPYIIGCLHGVAAAQQGAAGAPMPPMGGKPPQGPPPKP